MQRLIEYLNRNGIRYLTTSLDPEPGPWCAQMEQVYQQAFGFKQFPLGNIHNLNLTGIIHCQSGNTTVMRHTQDAGAALCEDRHRKMEYRRTRVLNNPDMLTARIAHLVFIDNQTEFYKNVMITIGNGQCIMADMYWRMLLFEGEYYFAIMRYDNMMVEIRTVEHLKQAMSVLHDTAVRCHRTEHLVAKPPEHLFHGLKPGAYS